MPRTSMELEIITPLLLGGAQTRGAPQLRAAPFRGEIRYWLRALLAQPNIAKLKQCEGDLLGSTDYGSPITVRVSPASNTGLKPGKFELLLHQALTARQTAQGFTPGQQIVLELSTHPLATSGLAPVLTHALELWLTLGSIGKRSRRGFGSLQYVDQAIQDGPALADHIGGILSQAGISYTRIDHNPKAFFPTTLCDDPFPYPAFAPGRWMALVCKDAFPFASDALYDFWEYHRGGSFKRSRVAFGYIKRDLNHVDPNDPDQPPRKEDRASDRRSSPFHLHISRTLSGFSEKDESTTGYHLVLTAFHASPEPSTESWQKTQELFTELWKDHQGALFYTPCPEEEKL